jgi:hypothetical protein
MRIARPTTLPSGRPRNSISQSPITTNTLTAGVYGPSAAEVDRPTLGAVSQCECMPVRDAIVLYGDPDDLHLLRNAEGDIGRIDPSRLCSMLATTLVRRDLFARGFPDAQRVSLADIPPVFSAFSANAHLPPAIATLLNLYHQDYLERGFTAAAWRLGRLAKGEALQFWVETKRRNRPPRPRGFVHPMVLVGLYRDRSTRPELLRLLRKLPGSRKVSQFSRSASG